MKTKIQVTMKIGLFLSKIERNEKTHMQWSSMLTQKTEL